METHEELQQKFPAISDAIESRMRQKTLNLEDFVLQEIHMEGEPTRCKIFKFRYYSKTNPDFILWGDGIVNQHNELEAFYAAVDDGS